MKSKHQYKDQKTPERRSREGAWIEIRRIVDGGILALVAPARERGLKCHLTTMHLPVQRRSREGAWIEIPR